MSVPTTQQAEHSQQAPYNVKAKSRVLEIAPAPSPAAFDHFSRKLAFETDCADVYAAFASGAVDLVLLDVRKPRPGGIETRSPDRFAALGRSCRRQAYALVYGK